MTRVSLSLCGELSIPCVRFYFISIGRLAKRKFGSHLSVKASNKSWTLQLQRTEMKCLLGSLFKNEGDRKQDRAGQDRTPASFVESESSRCRICGDALPLFLLYTMGLSPRMGLLMRLGAVCCPAPQDLPGKLYLAGLRVLTAACRCYRCPALVPTSPHSSLELRSGIQRGSG